MNDTNIQQPFMELTVDGVVASLRLSRPPMNPVNDEVLRQLLSTFDELANNEDLLVLKIISHEKAFCAGADLTMVNSRLGSDVGAEAMMDSAALFHEVYNKLANLPMATIAVISGHALGGGFEMALACDFRVAAYEAKLGLPEVNVGLLPGGGGTQRLTQLCGLGVAARVILTAELIDGREAEQLGMVQWACPKADLVNVVDDLVGRITAQSAPAVKLSKACIRHASLMNKAGVAEEINGIHTLMTLDETKLRIAKFLN